MTRVCRQLLRLVVFACLAVVMPAVAIHAATATPESSPRPSCNVSLTGTPAMARLAAVMAKGRFITFQPTSLHIVDGRPTTADPASVRADLKALRSRFDGLITYTALHGAEAIPGIAAALDYHALIVGVWDPFDDTELTAALLAAKRYPQLVVGISLGNEIVFSKRRTFQELAAAAVLAHRRAPELPISSTEPFHVLYDKDAAPFLRQLDFLLVNVHPVFQPWFRDAPTSNAAQFVVNVVTKLDDDYCGPILVKETGVPTAPAEEGFSEARQASFYTALRRIFPPGRRHAFAYFSAFDAPWRATDSLALPPGAPATPAQHSEEAHWGLYDADRHPKSVVAGITELP
jgi:exo-beta-1,3-glucanase (GH17 family)